MVGRVIAGGIVGGIVMFLWGSAAHLLTPIGEMGLSTISKDKEDAALAAMKSAVPADGLYFFPGILLSQSPSEAEQNAWREKLKAGPHGLLLMHPAGGEEMSPRQLITEFAAGALAALIASVLLATTRLGYAGRVGFMTLLGLVGWLSISVSYWNWYGFPASFTVAVALEEGIGWFLVGLAVAAIVRPARGAASAKEAV